MADYYSYLWRTTWPNLIALAFIYVIVFFRLLWKLRGTLRHACSFRGMTVWVMKACLWIGVLGIYTRLFLFSQPDWFEQPGVIRGLVQGKYVDSGSKFYVVNIRSGLRREKIYMDYDSFNQINLDDQVEIMYLPVRREAVSFLKVQ